LLEPRLDWLWFVGTLSKLPSSEKTVSAIIGDMAGVVRKGGASSKLWMGEVEIGDNAEIRIRRDTRLL
jgi:hypothetical protein